MTAPKCDCGNREWKQVYMPDLVKGEMNMCGECKRLIGEQDYCVVHLEPEEIIKVENKKLEDLEGDFNPEKPVWKCINCGELRQGGW
jgi:hypothetical protein